jgi:hypothetical protein
MMAVKPAMTSSDMRHCRKNCQAGNDYRQEQWQSAIKMMTPVAEPPGRWRMPDRY